MSEFFLKVVNMSISASWLVLAVLLLRLVLKKAPKWVSVLLWGFVAIRLICPFSIESVLSLIPSAETISPEIMTDATPQIHTGIHSLNSVINPVVSEAFAPDPLVSMNPLQLWIPLAAIVWLAGIAAMLIYTAGSYFLLRRKVGTAVLLRDNLFQSENVDSPFVLGIIKPKIYLPFQMDGQNLEYVIAHEEAHIRRKDHWWKPFGFLLLAIHWYNPLMWLGYVLLCRDIELACDEKVIKQMDNESKADYTQALVACSVNRRRIAACPLAFGEVGVKERVKSVMHYKKPALWIILAAVVTCAVVAVCFLTNPKDSSYGALPNIHSHAYVVEEVTYESGMYSLSIVAGENSPIYAINEDMELISQKEVTEEGTWAQLGKLEVTELTEENFDKLFKEPGTWTDAVSAKNIRKNTENAWRLIYNQEVLYYVLQQKNGDLYLAYGYQEPDPEADPGSFNVHIRWLYKLAIDSTGASGMVAKSGGSAVPMVSFPQGTMIKDYVDSIYWLTIDPGDEAFVPFSVWKDGEELQGTYTAYDAETFEPLKHVIPSGLDPQTYLFQNADPDKRYIVLATFSAEPDAQIYAFGAKFNDSEVSTGTLLSLVNDIANNPDCAASSNPFDYIEAEKARYNEILTYGSAAVDFFVEQLRNGGEGLQGYIMAVACADITGIGDKDTGADWATAREWLALYDKSDKDTLILPVIATDYISGKQARLMSFGYTSDKSGQAVIACGIAPWEADYGQDSTLVLDGKNGQNQILLAPKDFSLSHYRIYLPDGTVYDDGTREIYDSLSLRVMHTEEGVCLIAPFQAGEYIYEVVLSWPEQGLTVTYGLKVVMTGEESDYDRALDSVFTVYREGNPRIAVSLADKYTVANAVSSSNRYLFKVENVPNAPIWVEVSQSSGEIVGEVTDPENWLVDPPYVEGQEHFNSGTVETINGNWKTYYKNADGTWQADGRTYQHRLVITGRMHNAAVDSTFVYLSNLETITFEQAWKAAGFSSNLDDYFSAEEAVLVEFTTDGSNSVSQVGGVDDDNVIIAGSIGHAVTNSAITEAILDYNGGDRLPDGLINAESHYILGIEAKSGTPLAGQLNPMEETTIYIQYVYNRYAYTDGELTLVSGVCAPAMLTFCTSASSGYTLKEFWEPNGGSAYAEELRNKFPKEIADMVLEPGSEIVNIDDLESQCLEKAKNYVEDLTDSN